MNYIHDNNIDLDNFVKASIDYCDLIDCLQDGKPECFYTKTQKALAHLSDTILNVPILMPSDDYIEPEWPSSHIEWKSKINTLGNIVKTEISQIISWHMTRHNEENATRAQMLWDDLADIYLDIKKGLTCWQRASKDDIAQACWEWRWGYDNHWGTHLLDAMMTIHEIRNQLHAK